MGIIVLEGGGPFIANDVLDSKVLGGVDGQIAVLPTAQAFENPDGLIERARAWASRLNLEIRVCGVYTRADAREEHHADAIRAAKAVVLVGDSSIHLRSTLLNTPVWEAIEVQSETGVVIGVGNSASVLCDPMIDPRGGAFGLGLGLVKEFTALVEAERWPTEQMARTRQLATCSLAVIPTGSAVVVENGKPTPVGEATLHLSDFENGSHV